MTYQISRIRTCIIARPESVPHHSAIICAVPLLLYCSLYTYPLGYRDPSVLALPYYSYTPHYTPFTIRYIYILSSYATLIFLFYLYFYYFISTTILFIPLFQLFLLYSYISILYYPYHSFISIYTTLSTLAEILLLCIIRGRLSITYFI